MELLWLLIAGLVAFAVLYPLFGIIDTYHLLLNGFFIIAFVSYFRFIVFTKQIPYFKNNYVKGIFLVLNVAVFLFSLERLQYFFHVIDNYDNLYFMPGSGIEVSQTTYFSRVEFFKKELTFFMTGFIILIVILQFRLLFSKWKRKKST